MNISFYLNDLSTLKFLLPVAEAIHSRTPNQRMTLVYARTNKKYNGLADGARFKLFRTMMESRPFFDVEELGRKQSCDVLFTIETVGIEHFEYTGHYALQNGFDYQSLAKFATPKTTYLLASEDYCQDLRTRFPVNTIPISCPVTFWRIKDHVQSAHQKLSAWGWKGEPVATFFYPDEGHNREALRVIEYLERKGYFTVVKQRRKAQAVPASVAHAVYDDLWYPSESIIFSAVSHLSVGFASGAFCDLNAVGLPYVDARLLHPVYGLSGYPTIRSPFYNGVSQPEFEKIFDLFDRVPAPPPAWDFIEQKVTDSLRQLQLG